MSKRSIELFLWNMLFGMMVSVEVEIALVEVLIGHLREVVIKGILQVPTGGKGVALIMAMALVVALIGRRGTALIMLVAAVLVPIIERTLASSMVRAASIVLTKERELVLTMLVAPAEVLTGKRGLSLRMVEAPAIVVIGERCMVLRMMVAPAPGHSPYRRERPSSDSGRGPNHSPYGRERASPGGGRGPSPTSVPEGEGTVPMVLKLKAPLMRDITGLRKYGDIKACNQNPVLRGRSGFCILVQCSFHLDTCNKIFK